MKKHTLIATLATLACGAALAQAPAGTLNRPAAEVSPAAAAGAAGVAAQNKVDARTAGSMQMPPSQTAPMGNADASAKINPVAATGAPGAKAQMRVEARKMDANGDGMVSRAEWDRYHSDMWSGMKSMEKNGLISTADIDAYNRGAVAK